MATTYDNASLVMIPSGVKEDKLYSIKPTDGSGDFTFSRGSDIQATRVNSSGLIEKAKVNLALQSNTFSSWSLNTSVTETSGQSGYDGSSDAWKIDLTAATGRIQESNTGSGVQTYSVYAKAGTLDFVRLFISAGTNTDAWFNLSTGTYAGSNIGSVIDATITSVGSGWYRCTLTYNETNASIRIYPAQAYLDLTATSGNIYIQDAQLNHGLIAQDYVETTTAAVVEGLTADLPRLDYSGGASCPSLLLEPSRTNLVEYSEYIDSYWNPFGNISITDNDSISPEGVQNATKISATATTTASIGIQKGISVTANQLHTISFFAKKTDFRYIQIFHGGGQVTSNPRTNFDIQEGVVAYEESGIVTASVEDYGNGWYRCIATMEALTSTLQAYIVVAPTADAARSPSVSATAGDAYQLYGIQMEQGSYPTSYIPTYGTAANRGNETAITAANTLGGLSEGTFFIEMTRQGIDTNVTGSAISLRDNAGAEELRLHFDAPASQVRWRDGNNSFAQIGGALAVTAGTAFKILIKSDGTIAKVFGNGAQLGSDYSIVSAFDFQRIYNYQLGYEIKQQLFFPTALTDAEAIALTTI